MAEVEKLIERLRALAVYIDQMPTPLTLREEGDRLIYREAADAIAALQAENEKLRGERDLRASRISEALDEHDGFWRSCSGCHELNEGYPTGEYSTVFRTHVGCGCSECGGLGVVWDDTDYANMGDFMAKEDAAEARVAELEKALEPFALFAVNAVKPSAEGWVWSTPHAGRVCDWFAPSDFGRALAEKERQP